QVARKVARADCQTCAITAGDGATLSRSGRAAGGDVAIKDAPSHRSSSLVEQRSTETDPEIAQRLVADEAALPDVQRRAHLVEDGSPVPGGWGIPQRFVVGKYALT